MTDRAVRRQAASTTDSTQSSLLSSKRNIALVAAGTFCFWISLYLYVPVLPLHADELGASLSMIGLVVASYAIGQVTLRIPIGIASDIIGRKPFAVTAVALAGLGALWLGLAPNPWSLFAARTLTGVAGAGWVAISVLYSSYFISSRTTSAMAVIMSINAGALVLATLVGGVIADLFGADTAFFGAAAIGGLGAFLLLLAPEPKVTQRAPYSSATLIRLLKSPLLIQVAVIAITFQFVTFGVNFGFLPVLAESLGASKSEVGYITTTGLVLATVGTALSALMVRRVSNTGALLAASVMVLASLLLMPLMSTLLPLGALQGLNGFGRGMLNTICISLSLKAAAPEERATAMGAYQAIYAIGMLAGPVVSGEVAELYGIESVFWLCSGVTVLGALVVMARRLPRD